MLLLLSRSKQLSPELLHALTRLFGDTLNKFFKCLLIGPRLYDFGVKNQFYGFDSIFNRHPHGTLLVVEKVVTNGGLVILVA